MEAERSLLLEALALLERACPALEERSLLVDALKQLDELFLLVVVGEFNSGKSSVSGFEMLCSVPWLCETLLQEHKIVDMEIVWLMALCFVSPGFNGPHVQEGSMLALLCEPRCVCDGSHRNLPCFFSVP